MSSHVTRIRVGGFCDDSDKLSPEVVEQGRWR
jgi:hypothetical protein